MKKISEVSKLVGVSRRTLQYYDDEGLTLVKRSENNHRLYDGQAMERIWEILLYKEMGFELKEIKHLVMLSDDQRNGYLSQRMGEIKKKIGQLNEQADFIAFVQKQGMPAVGMENQEKTYLESIEELREKM